MVAAYIPGQFGFLENRTIWSIEKTFTSMERSLKKMEKWQKCGICLGGARKSWEHAERSGKHWEAWKMMNW